MKQSYILFIIILIISTNTSIFAQDHATPPSDTNTEHFFHKDTSLHSVKDFFKKSHLHGRVRNHFMATTNAGELTDYWTNATGGLIKLETAEWNGLQFGVAGIFTFQTATSDLTLMDTIAGKTAKWERELYDSNRPGEYKDLDRLEELYIRYNCGRSFVEYGKMDINTGPLFKNRDGRMKAFIYRGLWSEINEFKHQKITLGWLNGVSPRGMTEWYDLNEAIGINNNGYHNPDEKAHYHETSEIKGIGVLGYENQLDNGLTVKLWNFWFQNMFNMNWLQADYKRKHLFAGVQYVHQRAANHQEELAFNERYIQPNETGNVFSTKVGYKNKGFSASAAYLHAFNTGRFLFPRELGREDFYVSQPRSWIDGFGDLDVLMFRFKYRPEAKKWQNLTLDTRLSYTQTSDMDSTEFNKYKLPAFYQFTFLGKYKCDKLLDGLNFSLLYLTKYSPASENLTEGQQFYRSGIHHFSVMANIVF